MTSPFAQISNGLRVVQSDNMYTQEPPSFADFVRSPKYLGQPPLFVRQRVVVEQALGTNPELYFDNEKICNLLILEWGKGSGKDLLTAYLISYFVFLMLIARDIRSIIGMAPGEAIDVICVASNQAQSTNVLFSKLLNCIQKPCFRIFMPTINKSAVEFPSGIRLWAFHSKSDSYEGYSPFIFAMAEASAFQDSEGHSNARKVFRTLRTSAQSRYVTRWFGFITSYPRYDGDFITRIVEESHKEQHWLSDVAASWDVRDDRTQRDYQADLDKDPDFAWCAYGCKPSQASGKWFNDLQALKAAFKASPEIEVIWEPIMLVREHEDGPRMYIGIDVIDTYPKAWATYIGHGDPSWKVDGFSFVIGRLSQQKHPETGKHYVEIVAILMWQPDPREAITVDFTNVRDVIVKLDSFFHFQQVTFDQFHSAMLIQSLVDASINAYDLSFSATMQLEMYQNLRQLVNSFGIRIQRMARAFTEMKNLLKTKTRPDHPEDGSKDVSDGIAAVAKYLSDGTVGDPPSEDDTAFLSELLDAQSLFAS